MSEQAADARVAVVGLACRFPGAGDHAEFWANLSGGVESLRTLRDDALLAAGVPLESVNDPDYIKRAAVIDGADRFDASFFYLSARDAERMDPQMRVFLQQAWSALEHSGYNSESYEGAIGVFAGALGNTYALNNLLTSERVYAGSLARLGADESARMGNDSNYLTTRTSYHLNLTGPSIAVQTACSTALVAVHLAAQSLLAQECDMALAGGVSIRFPQEAGYLHEPDGILSRAGHCRPFDAEADGTVFGNGAGVVVLKRFEDALADGDEIWAVLLGSAVANDGSARAGFSAPGVGGQASAASEALAVAGVDRSSVGYVEAHGTGTRMGDPIEFTALSEAYGGREEQPCALGSVKGNIGHISVAAGIAGLIKSVLMLRHRQLVPTVNFEKWNPECDAAAGRFWIPTASAAWEPGPDGGPLRCGVHSVGMGGTTAHVILEEAPVPAPSGPSRTIALLPVSGKSPAALAEARQSLAAHLQEYEPEDTAFLADAAFTLATGRRMFNYRAAVLSAGPQTAADALTTGDPLSVHVDSGEPRDRPVAFMFPGQGAQYPGMTEACYRGEPVFRDAVDECARLLEPELGADLRDALYPALRGYQGPALDLGQTRLTQPAMFVVDYALARLWESWGVRPSAMIGHSVGEYVAAALAGVMTLPDALRVIAARGRLVQEAPPGSMIAVTLGPDELEPYLAGGGLAVAAVNEPSSCTVSGPADEIRALVRRLAQDAIPNRRVATSHAFHSAMMEPAAAQLADLLATVPLRRPERPFLSNVTGTWIRDDEATDPHYWAGHLRRTVRFADGIATLLADGDYLFLEVGPGQTLASYTRRHPDRETGVPVHASLGRTREPEAEYAALLSCLGRMWASGQPLDWSLFYAGQRRRHVPLPTYPFEGKSYWVEPGAAGIAGSGPAAAGKLPLEDWFSIPVWKQSYGSPLGEPAAADGGPVLVFEDSRADGGGYGVADRLVGESPALRVTPGDAFERHADGRWSVRPENAADYELLVRDLLALGPFPGRVVHCWSAAAPPSRDVAGFEQAQRHGLYSLIGLVKALSEHGVTDPVQIDVISAGAYAVTEADPEPASERVTLAVAAKVISQEHGNIRARHVDIPAEPDDRVLTLLADELAAPHVGEVAVALRGRTRWVAGMERLPLREAHAAASRLRQGGVYLITGGLGEIGTTIGGMLARDYGARLALLVRDPLPPREEWDDWLEQHPDADDETAQRITRLRRLEELGAEVLVLAADVADEGAMREALARVDERFGALHGVVHAAGLPNEQYDRTVTASTLEQCAWHFTPKAHGQIVLERVLADRDLDFCLLMSSLASVLGGLRLCAYGAANHFMDAAAARANRGRERAVWIAADWDVWQHHQDEKRALSAIGRVMDDKAIQPDEGLEAIRRILGLRDVSQVSVSTWDLNQRLDRWVRVARDQAGALSETGRVVGDASDGGLLEQVRRMVADALGEPELDAGADIFDHGGDSLMIVQLLSDVRAHLKVEVPLADVLNEPTARALTALIEARHAADRTSGSPEAALLALIEAEFAEPYFAAELENLLARVEAMDPAEVAAALAAQAVTPTPAPTTASAPTEKERV